MIRHVVMWKLKGPSDDERRAQAEQARAALVGLLGQVPGMSTLEVGLGTVHGEQQADLVLISTHDDWAALDGYQKHPAHQEVVKIIAELRVERRVLDFEF